MTETGELTQVTTTDYLEGLERQHRAQLLGLGAIALEMHQSGGIDPRRLSRLASRIAETERELELRGSR
jgi:hypothetical protein